MSTHPLIIATHKAIKRMPNLRAAVDPLIAAMRKSYRATKHYQLDRLLKEESKWKRRQTIADNHLADVREQINQLAKELCDEAIKNQKSPV